MRVPRETGEKEENAAMCSGVARYQNSGDDTTAYFVSF
jgi:hypothetical protein